MNNFNLLLPAFMAFDTSSAKSFITEYLTPITSLLTWAIPLVAIIAVMISVISYFCKDEEERDRHKLSRTMKKIIVAAILGVFASTILNIFLA